MVASCCICGIEKGSARDDNLVFHRFPKDENLRSKWWEVTGKKYASAQVCSKHFRPEDYRNYEETYLIRRRLKKSAIPQKNDNNLDTVEFVQNCFLSNCISLSVEEAQEESEKCLESVEQTNINPENSIKLKYDNSNVLNIGSSFLPQVIVKTEIINRNLDSDLTDVKLNDISGTIDNTNVESNNETIDSIENNDAFDKKIVENIYKSKMISCSKIKTSETDSSDKTIELVEIADTVKWKNTDEAVECLAGTNENETANDSTVEDNFNFTDESENEIFNILTDSSDDKTIIPTRSRKRETESYSKQKNAKEINKRKRKLRQIKKQRYQGDALGVTRREDFTSESAWMRFQNFIDETRIKYSMILSENRRLKQKLILYQHLLRYMNKKRKKASTDKIN